MCDLTNKYNYMMHYRMFKFYTNLGMKVTYIHTIYRFKQSLLLEKYINHNTQKRTKEKTNFEKDLYKLMNNAFFGKTMENVRERVNIQILTHTNIDQTLKGQSKLSFKGIVNHYSKFSVYKYDKEKTAFDKQIYLGFSVLELSKLIMYEFYYHKLQPYYSSSVKLHYMDTDSFMQKVRDHDHLTGKYRGAAHNRCNSNCKKRQVHLSPYFSTISVVMIVISYLKNSEHKLTKWGVNQK